jgi:hypothetical protein
MRRERERRRGQGRGEQGSCFLKVTATRGGRLEDRRTRTDEEEGVGLYNSFAAGRHFEGEGRVEAIRWCACSINSDFRGGYCDCNSQTHSDVPYV